jgi:hypothetical protein
MTVLICAPRAATAVEATVGIEADLRARRPMRFRFLLFALAALIISAVASWLAPQARAHNASGGSFGSSMSGGMSGSRLASGPMMGSRQWNARHNRSVLSMRRFPFRHDGARDPEDFDRARDFRHFHRRDRELFFPWGFGWPYVQSDFAGASSADSGDEIDWRTLPFWRQFDRYQPPTVEKSPSGVTIIRGPGSHHAFAPP